MGQVVEKYFFRSSRRMLYIYILKKTGGNPTRKRKTPPPGTFGNPINDDATHRNIRTNWTSAIVIKKETQKIVRYTEIRRAPCLTINSNLSFASNTLPGGRGIRRFFRNCRTKKAFAVIYIYTYLWTIYRPNVLTKVTKRAREI